MNDSPHTLSSEELEAIRERCEKATAGPWYRCDSPWGDGTSVHDRCEDPHGSSASIASWDLMSEQFRIESDGIDSDDLAEHYNVLANMQFIAHARTDIPKLLSEVERLNAENARLRSITTEHR